MQKWPVALPLDWTPDPNAEIDDEETEEGGISQTPSATDGNSSPPLDASGVGATPDPPSDTSAARATKSRRKRKMTEGEQRDAALGVLRVKVSKVMVHVTFLLGNTSDVAASFSQSCTSFKILLAALAIRRQLT